VEDHDGEPVRRTKMRASTYAGQPVHEVSFLRCEDSRVPWSAVVPVKSLAAAKTRLAARVASEDLAFAFAQDTISALLSSPHISRVITATSDPLVSAWSLAAGAEVFDDGTHEGINAAAAAAAAACVPEPDDVVIVLADLPCLTRTSLEQVLDLATKHRVSFVADAAGTGTTMWFGTSGVAVASHFGSHSRQAHLQAGAVDLVASEALEQWALVRRDVDTEDDLAHAMALGVGAATRRAVSTVVTTISCDDLQVVVIDEAGHTTSLPRVQLDAMAQARPGQRLLMLADRLTFP
jgi:2-phospho-L-lactate guanylyltransferase